MLYVDWLASRVGQLDSAGQGPAAAGERLGQDVTEEKEVHGTEYKDYTDKETDNKNIFWKSETHHNA